MTPNDETMKLHLVPARQGTTWVRRAFAVFFQRPLAFAALFTAVMFFGLIALLLPFIGEYLLMAAMPLATLGFMIATRRALLGTLPSPSVFIEPLRNAGPRRSALVRMGIVYAVASFLIMHLSDFADGGKFDALQEAIAGGSGDADKIAALLGDAQLQFGLLLRFGLAALLSLPFWHAPALVHWGGQTLGKAFFFSTMACWRNLGAFTVYGLAWGGVILALGLVANVLAMLLQSTQVIAIATVPLGLLVSTVFYTSLYFTFADSFAPDAEPANASA